MSDCRSDLPEPVLSGIRYPNQSRATARLPEYYGQKAAGLPRDERLLVERWLGRALSTDETSSVNVYRLHPAPARTNAGSFGETL